MDGSEDTPSLKEEPLFIRTQTLIRILIMNLLQFGTHKNFFLQPDNWGTAALQDITKLLDNVLDTFYNGMALELLINKQVIVSNAKNKIAYTDCPEIVKFIDYNIIYLSTGDRRWSQYAYQFAHELCHHIIDSEFFDKIDRFGWFEESLCELASIYCICIMSKTWVTNPPYPNWADYAPSLSSYVIEIINDAKIKSPDSFTKWLKENMEELYRDRCRRNDNRIIAFRLLPLFIDEIPYWQTVQYLKLIRVIDNMDFATFINVWEEVVPEHLKIYVGTIRKVLFS